MSRKRMNRMCGIADQRDTFLHHRVDPHQAQGERRARRKQAESAKHATARLLNARYERGLVHPHQVIGHLVGGRPDHGHPIARQW